MANSYLSRTPSSTGNRRKFTFSAWVKFNFNQLANNSRIFSCGSATSAWVSAYFNSTGDLQLAIVEGGTTYTIQTNRLFRDESAWYHLVFVVDTENATADNRLRMYVNGEEETSFSQRVNPTQDLDTQANTASKPIDIGSAENVGYSPRYFPGYMSHVAMVDGAVVAPTVFGETDSTSGIWKFKSPSGVTWGTNGFHLKFENSGALGTDSSGNSNTFTVNGNLKQALDTPSNVYSTMNPLDNYYFGGTFSNGNLTIQSSTSPSNCCTSTFGVSSGKWYVEAKLSSGTKGIFGVTPKNSTSTSTGIGNSGFGVGVQNTGSLKNDGSTTTSWSNTYTTNDILQVALDLDNNKFYFGINGTFQNSANPSAGTNGVSIVTPSNTATGFYFFGFSDNNSGSDNSTFQYNFGNGFFGTTAITSAGSNGNGSLFEYDVPTGFYALNTKNINTYG